MAKQFRRVTPAAGCLLVLLALSHVCSLPLRGQSAKDDAKPFARGINSFQLLNDGSRWWIVTIYWEAEDAGHQLPEKYLK